MWIEIIIIVIALIIIYYKFELKQKEDQKNEEISQLKKEFKQNLKKEQELNRSLNYYSGRPLELAVINNESLEQIKEIIDNHDNINSTHGQFNSTFLDFLLKRISFSKSSEPKLHQLVIYTVENGGDLNKIISEDNTYTTIHMLSKNPLATPTLRFILDKGGNPNVRMTMEDGGETPLHFAAEVSNNEANIKLLIEKGANLNSKDYYGFTPLGLAKKDKVQSSIDILSIYTDDKTVVTQEYLNEILYDAIKRNMGVDEIKSTINQGAKINYRYQDLCNDTPLHLAVEHDFPNINIIKFLIDSGADTNAKNDMGETPLNVAKRKISIGEFDNKIFNLLQKETLCRLDINELIADVNLKFEQKINRSKTSTKDIYIEKLFNIVKLTNNPELIKKIVEMGGDVNAKDKDGDTPLHIAALENQFLQTFKTLISLGAEINAKNRYDETPLDYAYDNENQVAISALIKAGADTRIRK